MENGKHDPCARRRGGLPGEKGELKDGRAAAIDVHGDALRSEARGEKRQESDDQPEADEQGHPAGAQRGDMKLKTEIAIAFPGIGLTRVAMGEFCGGVFLQMRLEMDIFEQACAQSEKAQEEENGGQATHDEAIVSAMRWKSQ